MTTNNSRKTVIRNRMAATGESYNVVARTAGFEKDRKVLAAERLQRWLPAIDPDDPCPCGGTCEPGGACESCGAWVRHVSRTPATLTDVIAWTDGYKCTGCAAAHEIPARTPGRPWGVAEEVKRRGKDEPELRITVREGISHPLLEG